MYSKKTSIWCISLLEHEANFVEVSYRSFWKKNPMLYRSLEKKAYFCRDSNFVCCAGTRLSIRVIGWRRLIGSPKLQIIFHKRATKYRSLLRKMTYKDKGSYESSPLCIIDTWCWQIWVLFSFGATTVQQCKSRGEVGGWGRDPKKCTRRDWGMGSSTI